MMQLAAGGELAGVQQRAVCATEILDIIPTTFQCDASVESRHVGVVEAELVAGMASNPITPAADLNWFAGAELDEICGVAVGLRCQSLNRNMRRMKTESKTFIADLPWLQVSSAKFAAAPCTILHNRHPVTSTTEADCPTPGLDFGGSSEYGGEFLPVKNSRKSALLRPYQK